MLKERGRMLKDAKREGENDKRSQPTARMLKRGARTSV